MSLQYTVAGVLQLNKELSEERDYYQQQCRQQYDMLAQLQQQAEEVQQERSQLAEERVGINAMKRELATLREAKLNSKAKDMKIKELKSALQTIEDKCKADFRATFVKMKADLKEMKTMLDCRNKELGEAQAEVTLAHHEASKRRIKHMLHRHLNGALHQSTSWAFRQWVHAYHLLVHEEKAAQNKAALMKRVKDAFIRRSLVSVNDQLQWAMKKWRYFIHHDVHNEHIRNRIYTCLNNRGLASTKDSMLWGLRQWQEFVHACHKEDLAKEADRIHDHHITKRVKNMIATRCRVGVENQKRWAWMLWKDWVQDCIFRDHVGERVRQVMKFKLMECANSYINWGFRHWKKVVHLATIEEHKQFLHQATQRRIKSCIERSLMGSVSDMYRWGFRTWKDSLHLLAKEEHADSVREMMMNHERALAELHEEHIRAIVRSTIRRRWMQTTQEMKSSAFRKWRETTMIEATVKHVVHSILEPHTAMIYKDIKRRIKAALQRQFKSSPREKTHILLLWSILEPVLYFSDLHKDLPNGMGSTKRNDRTRRVSTLNLEVNENIDEILQHSPQYMKHEK